MSTNDATSITRPPRPPKPPKPHPSITALATFLSSLPQTDIVPPPLPSKLRYDIYGSLLLLPPTSPLTTEPWSTFISSLPAHSQSDLYTSLAAALGVTHIAINSPIPAKSTEDGNTIRAPQITPLHGFFGDPNAKDFEEVYWTSTVQHGIFQTWCPLHTMFSRGNITEKSRIHDIVAKQLGGGKEGKVGAVDLFVGIGYFAFSYLKGGVDVVFGWDINRWSVEGCRRGAGGNKWGVSTDPRDGLKDERLVLFEESNEFAPGRLREIKRRMEEDGRGWVHIMHVNLGLLPSSSCAYKTALEVLELNDEEKEAWVHVHENVAREDVDEMEVSIIKKFGELAGELGMVVEVGIEHVEFVKSWAPGVWHCVFDVRVLVLRR
ncbi:hypothetical protein TWF481_000098 [Arthrobotrys musiformis]|uniref:tRNA wybutosine-synthesizing protein 2 n=1 Tax=Arthrobotrys musiformis TaxID=47236 RepID=A0AAV9WLQ9_9PEZI